MKPARPLPLYKKIYCVVGGVGLMIAGGLLGFVPFLPGIVLGIAGLALLAEVFPPARRLHEALLEKWRTRRARRRAKRDDAPMNTEAE